MKFPVNSKIRNRLSFGALATALLLPGCGNPPQLGSDQQLWSTTDALWTAVSSRRSELVSKAAVKLEELNAVGALNDEAHKSLNEVIALTKAGDWAEARKDLRAFIEGQQRPR
jgi:hypothetical protein